MGKTGIGKSTIFNMMTGGDCFLDKKNKIKVLESKSNISSQNSETKIPIIGVGENY